MSKKTTNSVETKKVKYLCSINNDTLPEDTDPDLEIQYIDIGNVDSNGKIKIIANYKFGEAPSRARRIVHEGDIIVSTVRTYLQAITLIDFESKNLIVSTGFAVIRPKENIYFPKFCGYVVRNSAFISEVQRRSVGVSYPAINASDLGDILVPVLSIEKQKNIANYLNKEINYIESLINAKQIQLQIHSEKRQALITQAVTKGINQSVKLKDSGVEWLGKVPEHWTVCQLKFLCKKIKTGSTPSLESVTQNNQIDIDWFTPVDFGDTIYLRNSKRKISTKIVQDEGFEIYPSNSILIIGIGATLGKAGFIQAEAYSNQQINALIPKETVNGKYLAYTISVLIDVFKTNANSATLPILNQQKTGEILVAYTPSSEEQIKIVSFIEHHINALDEVKKITNESIELLKEKRTSLITAAVTGQLEIPA